jgi:hypothetical protein
LNYPSSAYADAAGDVVIADSYNGRIRWVHPGGTIHTIAGGGSVALAHNGDGGLATSATFSNPGGVYLDAQGHLFIADTGDGRIREMTLQGGLGPVVPESPVAVALPLVAGAMLVVSVQRRRVKPAG